MITRMTVCRSIYFKYFIFCAALIFISGSHLGIDENDIFPFKALNMYFNEPYLTNLKVHGQAMEGCKGTKMAKYICKHIRNGAQYINSDLLDFGEQLEKGIRIAKMIEESSMSDSKLLIVSAAAKEIQTDLLENILDVVGSKIILPFSWKGPGPHALALQLERTAENTFKLVVFNSGDGVNYHYSKPCQFFAENDWRRVYPTTYQLWLEFENIPLEELFDDTAWFFSGFIHMLSRTKMDNAARVNYSGKKSVASYFYGSFLVNLIDYLKNTNEEYDAQTLVPAQRSGSCRMSSLLAALHYTSGSLKNYYKNRILLGYSILRDFLDNHVQGEIMQSIISDGSETVGRNLFKKLASTMALHLVQYLEEAHPKFRNSNLLGVGRRMWVEIEKNDALEVLKADKESLELIRTTNEYCKRILQILNDTKFDSNQTRIVKVINLSANSSKKIPRELSFSTWGNNISTSDIFKYIRKEHQGRLEMDSITIQSLSEIISKANKYSNVLKGFILVQDAFQFLGLDIWESELWSHVTAQQCLAVMTNSKALLLRFLMQKTQNNSLENILMISNLMILSWYAAVHYENCLPDKLGLQNFGSPIISFLKVFNSKALNPGLYIEGGINANFDPSTIDRLRNLASASSLETSSEPFIDIFELTKRDDSDSHNQYNTITLKTLCKHITDNPARKAIFDKLIDLNKTKINQIIASKRKPLFYSYKDPKIWIETSDEKLQLLLVFATSSITQAHRHFFELIEILYLSHQIFMFRNVKLQKNEIFEISDYTLDISNTFNGNYYYEFDDIFRLVSSGSRYCRSKSNEDDYFFTLRQSAVFLDRGLTLVGFEYWFSYLNGALDATVFSDQQFCTTSDLILNMPKLHAASDFDNKNYDKLFFPGFKKQHVEQVAFEMLRLINGSFKKIKEVKGLMDIQTRAKIIKTTVNMGIILTRFIARSCWHDVIPAKNAAMILANIYNEFYDMGKIVTDYNLDDEAISAVHLVLTQICSVNRVDEGAFLGQATVSKLAHDHGLREIFMRTMARYHWFVTKTNYKASESEILDISDALYEYGFRYLEMAAEEIDFMSYILRTEYIPKLEMYQKIECSGQELDYKIHFSSGDNNLNIAKITLSPEVSEEEFRIILHFPTGLIYVGNMALCSISRIIETTIFKKFFSKGDEVLDAFRGTFMVFGEYKFYYLSDFKIPGSDVAIIVSDQSSEVYRKINDKWYLWEESTQLGCRDISFNWMEGLRIFHRELAEDSYSRETFLIADEVETPIVKLVSSYVDKSIDISIGNLRKEKGEKWIILNDMVELSKTLENFGREDKVVAVSKGKDDWEDANSKDLLVIILPGMRLSSNTEYPVVLKEIPLNDSIGSEMEMRILNTPDLKVVSDQTFNDKVQIPFTLVVENKDEKRFLLLPKAEHRHRRIEIDLEGRVIPKTFTILEAVPIFSKSLDPQTRLQRLLLAYYFILAFEYDKARTMLHYIKSITHNDPFTDEELLVIEWIVCIKDGGPEADALKLLIYAQVKMSVIKFPLRYAQNSMSEDCKNQLTMIDKASESVIISYMNSIREISEKFYIHIMLPEITSKNLFELVFGPLGPRIMFKTSKSEDCMDEKISVPSSFSKKQQRIEDFAFEFKALDGETIANFLHADDKLTSLMIKLIHKRSGRSYFSKSDIIMYGLLRDREAWKSLNEKYVEICKTYNSDSAYGYAQKLSEEITKDYDTLFGRFFEGIDKSSKEQSDLSVILSVFEQDVREAREPAPVSDRVSFDFKVASDEHIQIFTDLQASLRQLLREQDKDKWIEPEPILGALLGPEIIGRFLILEKLESSIMDYSRDYQSKITGDINLTDLSLKLSAFVNFADAQVEVLKEQLSNLTNEIMMIRFHEENSIAKSVEELFHHVHIRKDRTFEDLYACYQRNSISCIQSKFPGLQKEQCKYVLLQTAKFYSTHILINLMNHVKLAAETLKNSVDAVPADDIEAFCSELAKIKDLNSRLEDITILNFEYRSIKYRLREEQVKDIGLLVGKDPRNNNNFNSIVIQRMMAAGKTLVLGTVSVIKKALLGPHKLSILVPPSSLYQSNTTSMQTNTYKYFKKRGQTFEFPRFETPHSDQSILELRNYLMFVLDIISKTMETRDYLILSPGCLQSFHNSYIEMINYTENLEADHSLKRKIMPILEIYATIYQIFRERSSIILDEIDMTMEPHKELNFPTREYENLNIKAAVLLADLIEYSTFNENIKNDCKLYIHSNEQYTLTDAGFERLKHHWIQYIKDQLLGSEPSIWKDVLIREDIQQSEAEKIVYFLSNPISHAENMEWIETIAKDVDQTIANALIIIRVQIHDRIRGSFKGAVNQSYGFGGKVRPGILYSVPYIAANTPSTNSVFADRWETLTKTLLMYASVPCPEEIAIKMIKYIREAIVKNLAPGIGEKDTLVGSICANLFEEGVLFASFDSKNRDHVELVHRVLKERSPLALRLLFSFALDEVLSFIEFPIEQITSNSLNMASMFASIQGYSGTIDNVNTLPHEVVEYAFKDNLENEKNNGGIARKLIEASKNSLVPLLPADSFFSPESYFLIDAIMKSFPGHLNSVHAIIDTGAFFKAFRNKSVAEGILKFFSLRINAVIYYNEETNQLEFIVREGSVTNGILSYRSGYLTSSDPESIFKATGTDIQHRFTFYDQRHITGSDILQPKHACAIMTVSARVKIREIMQGTLRMRQFMSSQKVHIITSESAFDFYRSYIPESREMRVSDVLALGCINEDEAQKTDNVKLAFMKIDNEIRTFVLDKISEFLNDLFVSLEWFRAFKSSFIRSIRERPIDWLKLPESRDAQAALTEYVDYQIGYLYKTALEIHKDTEVSRKLNEQIQQLHEKINEKLLGIGAPERTVTFSKLLQGRTLNGLGNFDEGREVQYLMRAVVLQELNLEVQSEQKRFRHEYIERAKLELRDFAEETIFRDDTILISLSQIAGTSSIISNAETFKFNDVFITSGRKIWVTADIIRTISNTEKPAILAFTKKIWEGGHFLVQVRKDKKSKNAEIKVTLLSKYFADVIYENMTDPQYSRTEWKFWLCDLFGNITASTITTAARNIMELIPLTKNLIFDALIFNGSLGVISRAPILKEIYENVWLDNINFKQRALFLLTRMRYLRDKAKNTMSLDSDVYKKLYRAASGDVSIFTDHFKTLGSYSKPLTLDTLTLQTRTLGTGKYKFPFKPQNGINLIAKFEEIIGSKIIIDNSSNNLQEQQQPPYSPIHRNLIAARVEIQSDLMDDSAADFVFNLDEKEILDVEQIKFTF